MSSPARIYLHALDPGYLRVIQAGFDWVNLGAKLKWGDTVFVKPNLTYPTFRRGVMTNPDCVEAVVIALKDYTDRIIVGEADSGGYNPFSIDEVFAKTGIDQLEKKYGVRVCNLSRLPYRTIDFSYKKRQLTVPLSVLLLDETDLMMTLPVPKIHMNTRVSMAVKNQWGCIPEPSMRLKLHPFFEKVVYEVNKHLRVNFAVVDGQYGLNRSGPMRGEVESLGWVMVANNIYAADVACCHLMQVHPRSVYYLRYLETEEHELPDIASFEFNQDWQSFVRAKFYLRRDWTDYPGLWAFRSPMLSYLAYYSPLAGILHKLLYLFREPFYDYAAMKGDRQKYALEEEHKPSLQSAPASPSHSREEAESPLSHEKR